jgi:hypothetical protein
MHKRRELIISQGQITITTHRPTIIIHRTIRLFQSDIQEGGCEGFVPGTSGLPYSGVSYIDGEQPREEIVGESRDSRRLINQGISAPIIGAAAENASLFMVYGKCQELITHFKPTSPISPSSGGGGQLGIGELMLAGAGAGAVTSFVLYVSFPLPPHLCSCSSPS